MTMDYVNLMVTNVHKKKPVYLDVPFQKGAVSYQDEPNDSVRSNLN